MPDITKFIADPEVALLIILGLLAIGALGLGKLIPRTLYDKAEARADKLQEGLTTVSVALDKLTDTYVSVVNEVKELRQEIKDLNEEIRRLSK
jgi:peptidoglycan hydrolase CwlO-like protein